MNIWQPLLIHQKFLLLTLNLKPRFFDDGDPKNGPELSLVQPDLKKWNFQKSNFQARYELKNLPHT